jgi:amino acid transporter
VTEVGRQPWIIQGVMRTADAVTPMPGIGYSFYLFTAVYFTLSIAVIFLLYRQIKMVPEFMIRNPIKPVSAMIYVVIIFLWVALLLYLVMGGADFGAGIIEMFTSNKNKSRTEDHVQRHRPYLGG